jgi:hypothetical protein
MNDLVYALQLYLYNQSIISYSSDSRNKNAGMIYMSRIGTDRIRHRTIQNRRLSFSQNDQNRCHLQHFLGASRNPGALPTSSANLPGLQNDALHGASSRGGAENGLKRCRLRRFSRAGAVADGQWMMDAETSDAESSKLTKTSTAIETAQKVQEVLKLIANTNGGLKISNEARLEVDGLIEALSAEALTEDGRGKDPIDAEAIFGFYDVAYVSVGADQVGQPAGGRFRSPLGRFLFKTIGLEQNLFKPNRIENRVAFTLLGCLPGEVTLEGTFAPLEGNNDGRTVEASFGPPGISVASGPKLRIGPKSKVVLSTTYLDDKVRLGKGSRGSLFVFKKKSAEQAEIDHRRWRVGGLAIAIMLATALWLGIYGVHQLKTTNTFLFSCSVVAASLMSLAMAYILRDGGIAAEDADLPDDSIALLTEEQKSFLSRGRADGGKKSENVFNI